MSNVGPRNVRNVQHCLCRFLEIGNIGLLPFLDCLFPLFREPVGEDPVLVLEHIFSIDGVGRPWRRFVDFRQQSGGQHFFPFRTESKAFRLDNTDIGYVSR